MIRTDLGGKLAQSHAFCNKLAEHNYIIEPTGPDAAVQNNGVERFNTDIVIAGRRKHLSSLGMENGLISSG